MKKALSYLQKIQIAVGGIFLCIFLGSVVIQMACRYAGIAAILMFYYGFRVTIQFWNYRWVSIPDFKRGPTWLCIPVCGATSALYLIGQIVEDVKALLNKQGGK